MATSFEGWLASWGDSWGPQVFDPNALSGTANITLFATGSIEGIYINPPSNGPSGGANWTRGYKPTHDYLKQRRRSRRDEILFLRG